MKVVKFAIIAIIGLFVIGFIFGLLKWIIPIILIGVLGIFGYKRKNAILKWLARK
ncbi:MAG: hypothetical protein LBD11_02290 [Candidatus Peribacteria bacterium]|jgi:hypothetical protein|nr:hypothetical protein [Candidatus Peribacteria bacterium]